MEFKFKNKNLLEVYTEDKELLDSFVLPEMSKGVDLINFGEAIDRGYTEMVDALVIVCDGFVRNAYYRGSKVATTSLLTGKFGHA